MILAWAMSRATTIGPLNITRVFTGSVDSVARISAIGRLRSMRTTSADRSSSVVSGRYLAGIALERFEKHTVGRDLAERLSVCGARHRDADGTRCAVTGQPDDAHVVAEVLAAELRADAELSRELEDLLLEFDVSEAATECVAARRQRVEVVGARVLRDLQRVLRARPADDDREVVRRAGSGAERAELVVEEPHETRRVEHRLGLLEEVALVGRAAAFRDEQELVGVARGRRTARSARAGCCRCSARPTR